MTHTTHLRSYPDMCEAISAIDDLYAAYLKAHKKKATVDLTVATLASPFDRSKRRIPAGPEPVEVRVKWITEQKKEMEWFVEATK